MSQFPNHPKRNKRQTSSSKNHTSKNHSSKSNSSQTKPSNSVSSPWQKAQQASRKRNPNPASEAKAPNTQWQLTDPQSSDNLSLTLHRYPANRQHVSLQAWDAADEYLINHLRERMAENTLPENAHILIVNDDFGALTCALSSELLSQKQQEKEQDKESKYTLTWQSDSYIAKQGCLQNLAENQLNTDHIQFIDSLAPLPQNIDLAIIKLPRAHALLEHQLAALQTHNIDIIAAGKVKAVQTSVLQLFEKYLGTTTTSLAVKKARLIFAKGNTISNTSGTAITSPYPTVWSMPTNDSAQSELTIHNHANVFSRAQLDIGARLLLDHLPDASGKTVVDLGCGNGVLGLQMLLASNPEKLLFIDESAMAVASAKHNVSHNFPEQLSRCEFVQSDCFETIPEQKAHVVVCNPPFHQQNTLTDHIAWQMFQQAKQALYPGGELRVVANRHLQHHDKLKRLFGGYQVVASNQKFSILSAINK